MNFIMYSGSYNVNQLGATKSVDIKVVENLVALGHSVIWVGRGKIDNRELEYCNIGGSDLSELIIRIYNKLRRMIFKLSPNELALENYLIYDKILEKKIKKGEIPVDENTIIIGRSGMSLLSFKEVKRRGGTCILRSQWLHPDSHNEKLMQAYSKIGLTNQHIPKKRIERQLQEIEIVDRVWCISSLVEQSYLDNNIKKEMLISCPLGVDLETYTNKRKVKNHSGELNILFVGNVNPEKGVHILFEALLSLKINNTKIRLVFNGAVAGYFKEIFNNYCEKLNKIGISIIVDPGIPLENYSRASLFILPSVHDSFGLVVLEAMASGLPVIVSEHVGAKDCVKNGDNGYIFGGLSSKQLSNKIQIFINNQGLLSEMGRRSYEIAKDYSWHNVVLRLVNNIEMSIAHEMGH